MITSIKFVDKENTIISVSPEGWVMPYDAKTWHKEKITQWEEGRTDAWDLHNADYLDYMAVMNYENLVAEHGDCIVKAGDWNKCGRKPLSPMGYNTQAAVDKSKLAHKHWLSAKETWYKLEINGAKFNQPEPVVLQRPNELSVIDAPEPLTPNIILQYNQPSDELIEAKKVEIENEYRLMAYSDVESNGNMWRGGIKSANGIKLVADFSEMKQLPTGVIHTVDHSPVELPISGIKDVAFDIGYRYNEAYTMKQSKLKALVECNDNVACIRAIKWG